MGLIEKGKDTKWTKENIAPKGQPPHFIDVGVVSPEIQAKMPSGKPFTQKNLFEVVIDDIKWALQKGI